MGDEFVESDDNELFNQRDLGSPKKTAEGESPNVSPRPSDGPSPLQRARTKFMNTSAPPTED